MTKFKVPRLYKAAAKIAKLVKEENANLEELVQQNNKNTNVKALSALVNKCLNSEKMLDAVIKNSEILVKEKFDNEWVVRILLTELLIGKRKLPLGSPTIQTILSYGPVLKTEHMRAQGKLHGKPKKRGGALKDDDLNTESESIQESMEGSEQTISGSKASLKRKRSNVVSEDNPQNQTSKSKKRKGENERYFELKGKDNDKELEEHQGPGTKKAKKKKKKKKKHAGEEDDDKETPDCITLEDDASDEGKPLWGKHKDYIKLEDDSIQSKFDMPKKKKKRYPVKKDKFSAEKRFSNFQKKSKKGKNKFNRDN